MGLIKMISLIEFYLSDKSKQTQMIIDTNTEIKKLNKENTILRQNSQYLVKQKDELEEVINKAIEYIEEKVGNEIHDMMYVIDVSDLLDILKGVDKE